MIILAPSILGADFKRLGEQVQEVDRAGAPYIHLDIMDGTFAVSYTHLDVYKRQDRKCSDEI